jgi:hypothetical protein
MNKKEQPWKKEQMIMTCKHVLKGARPEYLMEDESAPCSKCRDEIEKVGGGLNKSLRKNLVFVHVEHLLELPKAREEMEKEAWKPRLKS